ncbi:hypothetical protein DEAC_c43080 [Desulfosporosinus acididurans]|uniref:Uncharacterized protein n=1 Tax=Desulfosporosinus acididurans TaxID=476652 RepID=A0A0J1FJY1_9FIRM|nr:hypothetical protein [Desulfosporosinus acididurans]KLU63779.1 hypothetical protein DEAC_c43080 [Desulfosporosinus acididurans]
MANKETKKELRIEYPDHPRINSVTHTCKGTITWEKALELVIVNRMKRLKLLD